MGLDVRLLRQARVARLALAATILLGLISAIIILLQARQISRIVAGVFLEGETLQQVLPLMLVLLVIFVARAGFNFLAEGAAGEVAIRVKAALRELLLQKILRLGPAYAQAHPGGSGALTAAVVQGIEALDAYFSQFLPQLALAALIPLSILVVVFPLDWLTGVVLLVTAPLIPIFMILIGNASQAATRRQWSSLSRMSGFFLDSLQGLATLKQLGRSTDHATRMDAASEQYRAATMSVLRVTFLSALVLELVATLSTAVVAVEIGLRVLHARLEFEQAFFILMVAPEFYWPLRQLGLRFHAGMSGSAAAKQIFAILDAPEAPAHSPEAENVGLAEIDKAPTIEFRDVSYIYPDRAEMAVEGINLVLRPGSRTAIVGESGAGKSTLLQLILRFIEPTSGQILVNGTDLKNIRQEDWQKLTAWVPQKPYLFQATLAENIRLGKPGASFEELCAAVYDARLDSWMGTLPDGWDTQAGDQGGRLSGGEAQRVALARAFLHDARVLLMDEPTAHLDPQQELLLEEGMERLGAGRTVLTIAHRLPTIIQSDLIVVMEGGKLVEQGSHAQLMAQNGVYARLVETYGGAD